MITIYGIKNCDTMKKAFVWLEDHGVEYRFQDYKKTGANEALLKQWAQQIGWQKLLNTRGTTFRKLPPNKQTDLDEAKAIALMLENPSMIKRPIVESENALLIGFNPIEFAEALSE